jgi:hypothetical protein
VLEDVVEQTLPKNPDKSSQFRRAETSAAGALFTEKRDGFLKPAR